MALEIIKQTLTTDECQHHPGVRLYAIVVRSDQLKNDWMLRVCPRCSAEAETPGFQFDEPVT